MKKIKKYIVKILIPKEQKNAILTLIDVTYIKISIHFLRIHKSYIVNINHVNAIEGHQIKLNDQQLPIGKSYLVIVKKAIVG